MSDINKVWISGRAISRPVYTKLPPRTPLTTFDFLVQERFIDNNNQVQFKPNVVRVESLGRAAELARDRVSEGGRYQIEGYLRVDDGQVRIRTFAIVKEETDEAVQYEAGLLQALDILERSRNKEAAIDELRRILRP